jgi:hypothetical protein
MKRWERRIHAGIGCGVGLSPDACAKAQEATQELTA